jgi:hypothetical protein
VWSADKSVSVLAPNGWSVELDIPRKGVKILLSSPYQVDSDNLTGAIFINEDALMHQSIDDYIKHTVAEEEKLYPNFSLLEDSNAQLDGRPARKLVASMTMHGMSTRAIQYVVENNGVAYSINALLHESSFEQWKQQMERFCLSVEFHEEQGMTQIRLDAFTFSLPNGFRDLMASDAKWSGLP